MIQHIPLLSLIISVDIYQHESNIERARGRQRETEAEIETRAERKRETEIDTHTQRERERLTQIEIDR